MKVPVDVQAAAPRLRQDLYWGNERERHRDLCEDALLLAEFVKTLESA